jgi:hypothetical protein
MHAFVFVSTFIVLATLTAAAPVNDREKRQSGTYDYIVVGVSAPRFSQLLIKKM